MNVIPNVYQAAYMEGLTKRRVKEKVGLFKVRYKNKMINQNNKTHTLDDVRKAGKQGLFLGMNAFTMYTVETIEDNDKSKGMIYGVRSQRMAAEVLENALGYKLFPENTVMLGGDLKGTPQNVTRHNVGGLFHGGKTAVRLPHGDNMHIVISKTNTYPPEQISLNKDTFFKY